MKKRLLSILCLALSTTLTAQLDSSAFFVAPSSGMLLAQYINTPITPSLQFTDEFTLECWINVPASSSQEIYLIESYFGSTGGGFVIRLNQFNMIKAFAMGATQPNLTGNSSIMLNTWNHVAATYSSTTGELKVFLNGVQDGVSTPNIAIFNTASFLRIGARGDDHDVNDQFLIDEVRIWNVARSQTEIANNMNNCLTGNEAGLALYYDFENEAVSGTVTDRTSNGNNGTINNNVTPYFDGVFDCTSGGLEIAENHTNEIKIYPNPTTSSLTIETDEVIQNVSIFNIRGSLVQQEKTNSFSVEALSDGIYIVNLTTENGVRTIRFKKD